MLKMEENIRFDERADGQLTFEKASRIKGGFIWIDKDGVVRVYSKMREISFDDPIVRVVE